MKATRLLLLLLTAVLVDCSKSSDPAPPSLLGTWKETTRSTTNCTDTGLNSPETACTDCTTVVLSATNNVNTWTATSPGGSPQAGTWSPGGPYTNTTGFISVTSGSSTVAFTYTMDATTLTLVQDTGYPGAGCKINQKYKRQ